MTLPFFTTQPPPDLRSPNTIAPTTTVKTISHPRIPVEVPLFCDTILDGRKLNHKLFFIPRPPKCQKYYNPSQAVAIVKAFAKPTMTYSDVRIDMDTGCTRIVEAKASTRFVIDYMIRHKLIPCQKTKLYDMLSKSKNEHLDTKQVWSGTAGRTPLLSNASIHELTDEIYDRSRGGIAVSCEDVKEMIRLKIIQEWNKTRHLRRRKAAIPEMKDRTYYTYMNLLKSQPKFNIFSQVHTKTENRAISEWSLRSTISYALAVTTSHFIPAPRTRYHITKEELPDSSVHLWNLAEQQYNKVNIASSDPQHPNYQSLVPVLPNLLTTTDEMTIFVTPTIIDGKDDWYLVARPDEERVQAKNSESVNSNYHTKQQGDAHCRGLRIVLNNTFTGGGQTAPLFVTVYGLSKEELPGDDMVTVPIMGLNAGSSQNSCDEEGYICFVRGRNEKKDNNEKDNLTIVDQEEQEHQKAIDESFSNFTPVPSKEARVAELYRCLVYHPFIRRMRMAHYGWSGEGEVPDNLRCVTWMDGASGQLKLNTKEDMLEVDELLKIWVCKHSAARTGVEQAADLGPMFRILRQLMKILKNPHESQARIKFQLEDMFDALERDGYENDKDKIVRLPTHKRKALIAGLAKLPTAMGAAFAPTNIIKGFLANGQLDWGINLVPNLDAMLNTWRGNVDNSVLEDKEELVKFFYSDMFLEGMIEESKFEEFGVPCDTNSSGKIVHRNFDIAQENRQRAKILSSKVQRKKRKELIRENREKAYETLLGFYNKENTIFALNRECEKKLVERYKEYSNTATGTKSSTGSLTSSQPADEETEEIVFLFEYMEKIQRIHFEGRDSNKKKQSTKLFPSAPELRAFIQVRNKVTTNGKGGPKYITVPGKKHELIDRALKDKNNEVAEPFFSERPQPPEHLEE